MTLALLYPWIKAVHVAAALMFTGGVVAAGAFLRVSSGATEQVALTAAAFLRWDRSVTVPAMLLVWVLGIELAVSGHWVGAGWLVLKIILVVILSAIHGIQSGRLRRLSQGIEVRAVVPTWVFVGCVLGVAVLVVVKPF